MKVIQIAFMLSDAVRILAAESVSISWGPSTDRTEWEAIFPNIDSLHAEHEEEYPVQMRTLRTKTVSG